jgi:hypothetical protein
VAVVVGSVFGLRASSTYHEALDDHCPRGPTSCDPTGVSEGHNAHSDAAISTVAFIAGGVLVAGGATLYFATPRDTTVGVGASVGGGGLALRGQW